MKEYEQVRGNLLDMLQELDERLEKITEDVKHDKQPLSKDFAEQATESENDEVLDSLGNQAREEISLVKQALQRIDQGQYGVCTVCGEPIRAERLEALPYSDKCINCAQKEASNG